MDLVTALDEGSPSANASDQSRSWATKDFSTSLNGFEEKNDYIVIDQFWETFICESTDMGYILTEVFIFCVNASGGYQEPPEAQARRANIS